MLFSSLIVHGFTPNDFNEATIFPLIKIKRRSVSDSTNHRAIALSSPLAKLFDNIILHKYCDVFTTSDMQFGFKEHSSTTKCTFALTETVNYFRKNKSNVYVILVDATEAFDKVNYVKLFYQLIDRGLNPFIIRCLYYTCIPINVYMSRGTTLNLNTFPRQMVWNKGVFFPRYCFLYT